MTELQQGKQEYEGLQKYNMLRRKGSKKCQRGQKGNIKDEEMRPQTQGRVKRKLLKTSC